MTKTTNPADLLRAELDVMRPGWREQLRADLDVLQPGWTSFPVSVWDETTSAWVDVVLLAHPESVSPPARSFWTRLARWLGRR